MKILVVGGTGTVGSQVAKKLLENGHHVRVMTRFAEKVSSLPKGAESAIADLEKPETLAAAFKGADAVFILNALAPNETEQGLAAVEAAKNESVKKIVYLAVHDLMGAKHVGHFGQKVPVVEAIKASGIDYTILAPNNYFQNDFWFTEVIKNYKVYPQPIGGRGITRVDVRDVADAAVNALTKDGFSGKTYALNGPDEITGEKVASVFSKALGTQVNYAGDDLESWAAQSAQFGMPDWMVKDLKAMYKHFQTEDFKASAAEMEAQKEIIGHEPRSFESFVEEHVEAFR
jgi:uncharacterized protein YbjT (DUF2867 family)